MRKRGSMLARIGLAIMLVLMLLPMTALPAVAAAGVALDQGFYKTGATANITVEVTPGAGAYDAIDGLVQTIVVNVNTDNPLQGTTVVTKVTLTETGLATNIYKGSVKIVKTLTDATMKTEVIGDTGNTITVAFDANDDGGVPAGATDIDTALVDNVAPTLKITAPTFTAVGTPAVDTAYIKSGTTGAFFAVTATGADAVSGVSSIAVSTDGGASYATAVGAPAATFNWGLTADGTFGLKFKATDVAGNSAIYPDEYDDGGAGAFTITVGAPNGTAATVTAAVTAGVDGVFGTTDDVIAVGTAGSGYSATTATGTATGGSCTTAPTITATRTVGADTIATVAVTTNGAGCTAAYTVTIAAPTMTQAVPGALTFDGVGGITAIALGTAGAGYATAPTVTIGADDRGTGAAYTATVGVGVVTGYVTGTAGNGYDSSIKRVLKTTGAGTTAANPVSVKVDNTKPVVSDAAASPAKAHRGTSTTLTVKVVDATAGVKSVTADTSAFTGGSTTAPMLDDGVSPDKTKGDGIYSLKITNVGTTDGDQTVKVTAEDKSLNKETTVSVVFAVVNDQVAPKVNSVAALGTISGASTVRSADMVEIIANATDDLATTLTVTADVSAVTGVTTDTAVALTKVGTTTNYSATVAVGVALDTVTAANNARSVKVTAKDSAANSATGTVTVNIAATITSYQLKLAKGWNLVSLPMSPASNSIVDAFDSVKNVNPVTATATRAASPGFPGVTRVTAFFGADNRWRDIIWTTQWSGTPGFGDTGLIGGQAYFVESRGAVSVTIPLQAVSALDTPPTYAVPAGWSTIPYVNLGMVKAAAPAKDYVKGLSVIALYKFDAAAGIPIKLDLGSATVAGDDVMIGQGYWIFVDKPGTLVP